MKIVTLEQHSSQELRPLIANCKFVTFKEYGLSEDLIVDHIINQLTDLVARKGKVFVAQEQEKIIGLVSLEKSDWDSSHFGINISKISHLYASGDYFESYNVKQKLISHLQNYCLRNLCLHVTTRVYKEDLSSIHSLESKAFQLMDVLVTYLFDFRKQSWRKAETETYVRRIKQDEIPQVAEIAKTCFANDIVATDRFHADPTLPWDKSGQLYVKWLVDSIADPLSIVFVAEVDAEPIGFNICSIQKPLRDRDDVRLGKITLTAVKPSQRNRNVAFSMLNASLGWFADKVDFVETGGQVSNFAVQRAWIKTGFTIARSQCTFRWSILPENHR